MLNSSNCAKLFVSLILIAFLTSSASGQSLAGVLVERGGAPAEFTEVVATNKTNDQRLMTVTDTTGRFTFEFQEKGWVVVRAFRFGQQVMIDSIQLLTEENRTFTLDEDGVELERVEVVSSRQLIESKVDRLVFNVTESVAAEGTDVTQALELTPLIAVSEFGIQMVGKGTTAVFIDGRPTNLSGADLIGYLRSLRSDDVSKIEVITTPPARYEAEGNSGILNIVLKKDPRLGWNVGLNTTYTQSIFDSYAGGARVYFNSKKLSMSVGLNLIDRQYFASEDIDVIGELSNLSSTRRKDDYESRVGSMKLGYKIAPRLNAGVILTLIDKDNKMGIDNRVDYGRGAIVDSTLQTNSVHVTDNLTSTLSAYTNYEFTDKSNLEVQYNRFNNSPERIVDFSTTPIGSNRTTTVQNGGDISYLIESVQADYARSIGEAKFESGAKFTDFQNLSSVFYDDLIEGSFIRNPERSNTFDYQEKNYALYFSLAKKINEKLSAKAGLRYEYTDLTGVSGNEDDPVNRNNYGNLFPTAYLSYRVNEKHKLNLSYSRRINRPSFRQLSPFRWYDNPLTYGAGNPLLLPSINDNFDLGYNFNSVLNLSLYAQLMNNGIGRIVLIEGAEKIVRAENYLNRNSYGISGNLNLSPRPWLDSYLSVNAAHSTSSSSIPVVTAGSGYSFYYSINNTISPLKNKQFKLLANFWHQLPAESGNAERKGIASLSVGVRGPIKETLRFNLMFGDVFRGLVSRGELLFTGYSQFYRNYYDSQRVNLTLSYRFGNQKVRGSRKSVKFLDKRRGGY